MCHERWLRTFGRYPSLRRQTPAGLHIMTPVVFPFPELTFINFDHFTLSFFHLRFPLDEVQYDFPAKRKPFTCSSLIYVVFSSYCMRRHCLHYVLCQKHYIQQRGFTLVDHDECPSPRLTLHRSPFFPFPHRQRCLSMTLSLSQRRMLLLYLGHISLFGTAHSWRNFTPFSWCENKNLTNILVGKSSAPTTLRPKYPAGTMGMFLISSW